MRWILQNISTGTVVDAISDPGILDQHTAEEYFIARKRLERNKFMEFGKNAKENSRNFYWDNIIKKYLEII